MKTILSLYSVVNFELEENDYSASERTEFIEVTIRKNLRLANRVTALLTPYAVEDAIRLGQPIPDGIPDDDNPYSPNRARCKFLLLCLEGYCKAECVCVYV